jgi:cytochrome c-type biogenesis protein CcmH/NrfG
MRKPAVILLGLLVLALASCRGEQQNNARPGPVSQPGAASSTSNADPARLDAEIARLERLTERNPADDEARTQLAQAYVRRANTHHAARRLPEALADYRRAQRLDPDNEEAQRNVADIAPQVEGTPQEGEYGEPAPPPISPNVEGEGKETPEKP